MDMERIPCRQHFVGGKVVEGRVVGFGGLRFFLLLKMIDGCFGGNYGNIPGGKTIRELSGARELK
jgi:hypothetical protein